jgi:hypothetical protein
MAGNVLMSGMCYKKGRSFRQNWKLRYCELTKDKLQYSTKMNGELKGELKVDGSLRVTPESIGRHTRAPTQWLFTVHTADGPFIMGAETSKSMHEWMDAISLAYNPTKEDGPQSKSAVVEASVLGGGRKSTECMHRMASQQTFDDDESSCDEKEEETDKRSLERKNSARGDNKRTKSMQDLSIDDTAVTTDELHIGRGDRKRTKSMQDLDDTAATTDELRVEIGNKSDDGRGDQRRDGSQ